MTGKDLLPFPDVPRRPLRVLRHIPPRRHADTCPHAWVYVNPLNWTDAQRNRARPDYSGPTWVYTPACPGCDDLVAWHQDGNRRAMNNVPHTSLEVVP